MRITLIAFGKIKAKYYKAATQEYENRLQHYTNLKIVELKDTVLPESEIAQAMREESERLLSAIPSGAFFVALDSRGQQMPSIELAKLINEKQLYGPSDVVFAIGGAFGFDEIVLKRANLVLSLSEMTLPHELARTFLLEQIYRSFTILKGEKYHK